MCGICFISNIKLSLSDIDLLKKIRNYLLELKNDKEDKEEVKKEEKEDKFHNNNNINSYKNSVNSCYQEEYNISSLLIDHHKQNLKNDISSVDIISKDCSIEANEELFNILEKINLGKLFSLIKRRGPDSQRAFIIEKEVNTIINRKKEFNNENNNSDCIFNVSSNIIDKLIDKDIKYNDVLKMINKTKKEKDTIDTNKYSFLLMSSVLSLRGSEITKQPYYENNKNNINNINNGNYNLLSFNGEIFSIDKSNKILYKEEILLKEESINTCISNNNHNNDKNDNYDNNSDILQCLNRALEDSNDTQILYHILNNITTSINSNIKESDRNTLISNFVNLLWESINSFDSDHAFIYYNNINDFIAINRDLFGKRSLVICYIIPTNTLFISSCLISELQELNNKYPNDVVYFEFPSNSIMIIDMMNNNISFWSNNKITKPSDLRFKDVNKNNLDTNYVSSNVIKHIEDLNICHINTDTNNITQTTSNSINNFNINSKILDYSNFKNTVYSLLCKSLQKRLINYKENSISILYSGGVDSLLLATITSKLFPNKHLELFSLSFNNKAPDKQSSIISYYELLKIRENDNKENKDSNLNKISLILAEKDYETDILPLENQVLELIYPSFSHMDFNISTSLKVASELNGVLLDNKNILEIMDLYYSSFKNSSNKNMITDKTNKNMKDDEDINKQIINIPDTIIDTIDTQKERKKKEKKIKGNDFSNNILSKTIPNLFEFILTHNNNKISNDNNALDLKTNSLKYHSSSKIVLSGLGADELFGGYARYRTSHLKGELIPEMSKDLNRIWYRNFGRDDRACSDNRIELRFPFFDLNLINYLSEFDVSYCANFDLNRGEGEKKVLRDILVDCGFDLGAGFEKRAIQFGSSLAKETNIKKFGSNRRANGRAQLI